MSANPIQDDGFGERRAGGLHAPDGTQGIEIDHMWGPDCPEHGDQDMGCVSVIIYNDSKDGSTEVAGMHLEAGEALMIAAFLQKAAGWAMETFEHPEPVSRAVRRLEAEGEKEA